MENLTEAQANALANVIRIAGNINSIAVDGLDGYATPEQAKREITACLDEIKSNLQGF